MAFANEIYAALGRALNKPPTAIEPLGAALRKAGHWPPTKPGKGAVPLSAQAGGLLMILEMVCGAAAVHEPAELGDKSRLLTYTNLTLCDTACSIRTPLINKALGIVPSKFALGVPCFADYIYALVRKCAADAINEVVNYEPLPHDKQDEFVYDGPEIIAAIKGPFPLATISFQPSSQLVEAFVAQGMERSEASKQVELSFRSEYYEIVKDRKGKSANTETLDGIIYELRKKTARGVRFQRSIHGEVFDAVGSVFRNTK